jgi:cytochrome oxidase Cu insertion factor (SCO1/SenC/PrrC family)
MLAQDGPVARVSTSHFRKRYLVVAAALVVGVLAGVLIARTRTTSAAPTGPAGVDAPQVTWTADARPAPDFALTDQSGKPISLARFRGRPIIVTFIDPLCRNLCPLEAKILERSVLQLPASQRPEVVSVSVDRWANTRKYLLQDNAKWSLDANWHWAVGPAPALAKVWRDYQIGVLDAPRTVAGVTVHNISHTEASYVLDPEGNERALFLYPFSATDVSREVSQLAGT